MRYLSLAEVLLLHRPHHGPKRAAIPCPRPRCSGVRRRPTAADVRRNGPLSRPRGQAAALGFSLIQNHPFVDGNKRVGHAAMLAFLRLNGGTLEADVDDAERTILQVASGALDRAELQAWVESHQR